MRIRGQVIGLALEIHRHLSSALRISGSEAESLEDSIQEGGRNFDGLA